MDHINVENNFGLVSTNFELFLDVKLFKKLAFHEKKKQ